MHSPFYNLRTQYAEACPVDDSEYHKQQLNLTKRIDIGIRLVYRVVLPIIFIGLLWYQVDKVFHYVDVALKKDQIRDLQLVLSVLITGIIGETIAVLIIMCKFIFSEAPYSDNEKVPPCPPPLPPR